MFEIYLDQKSEIYLDQIFEIYLDQIFDILFDQTRYDRVVITKISNTPTPGASLATRHLTAR